MLIVVLGLLIVLSVAVFGGRLQALAAIRPRHPSVVLLALALQVAAISVVPTWPRPILVTAHLASYGLAGWFVFQNRRISGLPLIALGGALNGVTIALNGGTLPASRAALARAGIDPTAGDFNNSAVLAHPHLPWLGDIFAVPASWPFSNVFSIGDVLVLVGLAYGLHRICDSRLVPRRWHRPAAPAPTPDVANA